MYTYILTLHPPFGNGMGRLVVN